MIFHDLPLKYFSYKDAWSVTKTFFQQYAWNITMIFYEDAFQQMYFIYYKDTLEIYFQQISQGYIFFQQDPWIVS